MVDGLTAVRNAVHDEGRFREFMHGLMAFTKQRLMTTVLCYEHPELFGISRFMPDAGISSIVDNIILLNFVELGDRLHRIDYDLPDGRWSLDSVDMLDEMSRIGHERSSENLAALRPVFFSERAQHPYHSFPDTVPSMK